MWCTGFEFTFSSCFPSRCESISSFFLLFIFCYKLSWVIVPLSEAILQNAEHCYSVFVSISSLLFSVSLHRYLPSWAPCSFIVLCYRSAQSSRSFEYAVLAVKLRSLSSRHSISNVSFPKHLDFQYDVFCLRFPEWCQTEECVVLVLCRLSLVSSHFWFIVLISSLLKYMESVLPCPVSPFSWVNSIPWVFSVLILFVFPSPSSTLITFSFLLFIIFLQSDVSSVVKRLSFAVLLIDFLLFCLSVSESSS